MIGEVAHFRVLERAGEGGMGVVYRAEDTALKRAVALKFITQKHATDKRSRERFIREAQTAASLNHPNVCTIHEVGEIPPGQAIKHEHGETLEAGTPYIAMEFLEGETLRTRISRTGPLNVPDVVSLAIPIAKGLAAAHAQGIVHRDLKPSNVMLTSDGQIKILDFGLAKPVKEIDELEPMMPSATTMVPDLTQVGTVVGTVSYMSPEQVSGKSVDSRSDVFSFGTMLYEMVVGLRPFDGDTQASTAAKILEIDPTPPISEITTNLPPELARIIRRCLRKKPDDRFNDTRDLVVALKDLKEDTSSADVLSAGVARTPSSAAEAVSPSKVRKIRTSPITFWGLLGVVVILLAVVVAWFALRPGAQRAVEVSATYRQVTFSGKVIRSSLSPDGEWIAYIEKTEENDFQVLVQDLGGGSPIVVLDGLTTAWSLEWSPTGAQLLSSGIRGEKWGTFIIPRVGGTVRSLPGLPFVDWSPDGSRIAGTWTPGEGPIRVLDVATGEVSSFELADSSQWYRGVDWSPAERIFVLTSTHDYSRFTLWTVLPDGGEKQRVLEETQTISSPCWSPSGDAVYFLREGDGDKNDLMRIGVHPTTGAPVGDPITVIAGFEGSSISVSNDGKRLLYLRDEGDWDLWILDSTGSVPTGELRQHQLTRGRQSDEYASVSPNGDTVAFIREVGGGAAHVFTMPLDGGEPQQITFLEESVSMPVWSADGKEIAFKSEKDGISRIWSIPSSGGTPRVYEQTMVSEQLTWAPGLKILYQRPGNRNFHFLDPETKEETPLVKDESVGWIFYPAYSPDGSQVAVSWNRSCDEEYCGGVWLISTADGTETLLTKTLENGISPIRWSADANWVYAQDEENHLVRIPVSGGDPEVLLTVPFEEGYIDYLSPDGNRMVLEVLEGFSDLWIVDNFDPDVK